MATLKYAHNELFQRAPDERFRSLDDLEAHCRNELETSTVHWKPPQELVVTSDLTVAIDDNPDYQLNDWSFSQLCRIAGVNRDTVNRVSRKTASRVFGETLPFDGRPIQVLTRDESIRSIHGMAYTRLWNSELLDVVRDVAVDFRPPQTADGGGTGLYCGERDMFCFLIDPTGWTEINGQAFAPGFFLYNSEVGCRSVGIQTFWFQEVCANHIVWDAVEVIDFKRKHTANVHEAVHEIRRLIESLVRKRDERRDGFVNVMRTAMTDQMGSYVDETLKKLLKHGFRRKLAEAALEIAGRQGSFTIFSIVDALTQLAQRTRFIGERTELDVQAAALLELAV